MTPFFGVAHCNPRVHSPDVSLCPSHCPSHCRSHCLSHFSSRLRQSSMDIPSNSNSQSPKPYTGEDDPEMESLSRSFGSTHFSTMEDKFIKDHDLKVKAFEALHDPKSPKSLDHRRPSVIELPQMMKQFHPPPSHAAHTNGVATLGRHLEANANALPEEYPSDELIDFYGNVKLSLELRHKYQNISLQTSEMDNPKNRDDWDIYPPPPKPTYKSRNRFNQLPSLEHDEEEEFDFSKCEIPEATDAYDYKKGEEDVFEVYDKLSGESIIHIPTLKDFYSDLNKIAKVASDGPTKSFSFKRLEYLEAKWNMYTLLNEFEESKQSKRNPHRDFYNVRKVDTHIHHSACMNQKHLLRYIKYKLKTTPDEEVIFRDGKVLTLAEVFKSLNLTGYDLSIDTLDMHAHTDSFQRFDKFNLKYNPIGESRLREIFLKTDNYIKGKYLAEITKQVFDDLEGSKYQMSELRISIYGRSYDEWDKLAAWIIDNKLVSHNVRWLIQIPRLYDVYQKNGNVKTFQDIMTNLFEPLIKVSLDPQSNPKLHVFLQRVVGFDTVDDESKPDTLKRKYPPAGQWDGTTNPPYSYYLYYVFANMSSLNNLRSKLGFNTFLFRPHSGEAGDPEHLISSFLVAHSISHGILLRKVPFVQYLFFLDQIGMAMSPLSNNALFLTYDKNPFHSFFRKGLNVSLSTDDPLQFSYTKEPLIEEYSVAGQIYKLSAVDMCELARNSVLQSGWEAAIKKHWLGKHYMKGGTEGNNIEKTNVPNIRVSYREQTHQSELDLVEYYTSLKE